MNEVPGSIVIMGVCGAGKTEVGRLLAAALGGVFDDADDFHSEEAKAKMGNGQALTDEDRWPWLDRLRLRIEGVRASGQPHVLACSALRSIYRDRLRGGDQASDLAFVLLDGSKELILGRMAKREGHYMPVSLLDSQLALLERTPDLVTVSIEPSPAEIAQSIVAHWKSSPAN